MTSKGPFKPKAFYDSMIHGSSHTQTEQGGAITEIHPKVLLWM